MTDKQRYIKFQSTGYRVNLFYGNRSNSLHFVLYDRAVDIANFLKDSGRYNRITVSSVISPWVEEEV